MRLFPADPTERRLAAEIHASTVGLPIVSPHGHTDASWFALDTPFANPTDLFITPDHYVYRMLHSRGVPLEALGLSPEDGGGFVEPEVAWSHFGANYHLFRGTPTRLWLDHVFEELFGLTERLTEGNAAAYYAHIDAQLALPDFRPRALFERFNLEVLATTDPATSTLDAHHDIVASSWTGRVIPTFRPDGIVVPTTPGFRRNLEVLGEMTGEDTGTWNGYLAALRSRRQAFRAAGGTATDHGHERPLTVDLPAKEAAALFQRVAHGAMDPGDAQLFPAQMLTEMAAMSIDDGLVMQLHPGSFRNHDPRHYGRFGPDTGADIPVATEYTRSLQPLLARFGDDPRLTLILFTLDESTYARELAPLAGHYPTLLLGPPWWFFDAPDGMARYRELVTETAGFYNTAGFNDDTRALLSIPARHDVARRMDASYLAGLVARHRLDLDEALDVAEDLAVGLARRAYRLDR